MQTTVQEDYRHEQLDWAEGSRLILITAHRRENLGEPMRHMFRAIKRIVEEHEDIKVICPIHMNPVVRETANEILGNDDRIRIIEPLEVLDFHNFLARSYLILTDSVEHSARRFRADLPPFQSNLSALLSTPFRKSSAYLSGDECNDRFSIPCFLHPQRMDNHMPLTKEEQIGGMYE